MKLTHDKQLSNFACFGFNCKLRPSMQDVNYTALVQRVHAVLDVPEHLVGRCRFTPG